MIFSLCYIARVMQQPWVIVRFPIVVLAMLLGISASYLYAAGHDDRQEMILSSMGPLSAGIGAEICNASLTTEPKLTPNAAAEEVAKLGTKLGEYFQREGGLDTLLRTHNPGAAGAAYRAQAKLAKEQRLAMSIKLFANPPSEMRDILVKVYGTMYRVENKSHSRRAKMGTWTLGVLLLYASYKALLYLNSDFFFVDHPGLRIMAVLPFAYFLGVKALQRMSERALDGGYFADLWKIFLQKAYEGTDPQLASQLLLPVRVDFESGDQAVPLETLPDAEADVAEIPVAPGDSLDERRRR